jgi:prephenate dehydratase
MQVAWLKEWSYTHEVWKKIWLEWVYIPQNSNWQTIDFVRNWWVWIVPIMNTYWWSVREEIGNIIKLTNSSHTKWWYNLWIKHVLAWSGKVWDLKEIHAHKQALIQCSEWLDKIWASTEDIINSYNSIKEIPGTTKCIIEINDWIWILEKITAIFEKKLINIRHLHSFPSLDWKYKFYISFDDTNASSLQINKELEKIWWQMILDQKEQIKDSEIKLVPRNTNADWIPEAQNDSRIWVICSEETALSNWLQILNKELSLQDNTTSFVVLANNQTRIPLNNFKEIVQDRVIWLLNLPNKVWILRQSLSIIRNVWLSLSFILSLNDGEWGARIALVMNKWVNWEIMSIQKDLNKIQWSLKVI